MNSNSSPSVPSTRVVHVNDRIDGAVYIGRAMPRRGLAESPLANPFKIGANYTRRNVINNYRDRLYGLVFIGHLPAINALIEVRTAPAIACWCRHDGEVRTDENACHADVVLELIARYSDDELKAFAKSAA